MARNKVKLNDSGIRALLTSGDMHRAVQQVTEEVARHVEEQGIRVGDKDGGQWEYRLPVKTEIGTSDRARGAVIIAHASGLAVQAKHGVLTKAASAAGLSVRNH